MSVITYVKERCSEELRVLCVWPDAETQNLMSAFRDISYSHGYYIILEVKGPSRPQNFLMEC